MPSLVEGATFYVEKLTAAGLRAVYDRRDVNPPCVVINAPTIRPRVGQDCWDADYSALVVVPDSGPRNALAALDELLSDTLAALPDAVTLASPVLVGSSTDPSGTLPGYRLTWSVLLT